MEPTLNKDVLGHWIGRTETVEETVHLGPASLMEMTMDRTPSLSVGDALPPLWHWLYFLQSAPMRALGRDGHPAKGGFLPPVALPRRMWAGGRFGFHSPLEIGAKVVKDSMIKSIEMKSGRSGALCFVTVRHEIGAKGRDPAFWEEHDIVYCEDPSPDAQPQESNPIGDHWHHQEVVTPTEVLLFRYSALTFNGHRIHYDREYAKNIEGHGGLVVHGPLIATLLVDLAQRRMQGANPKLFEFRAASPLFDTAPFTIHAREVGNSIELAAATPDGRLAMRATATF